MFAFESRIFFEVLRGSMTAKKFKRIGLHTVNLGALLIHEDGGFLWMDDTGTSRFEHEARYPRSGFQGRPCGIIYHCPEYRPIDITG